MTIGELIAIGVLIVALVVLTMNTEPEENELNKDIKSCIRQGKTPVLEYAIIKGIKSQWIECK